MESLTGRVPAFTSIAHIFIPRGIPHIRPWNPVHLHKGPPLYLSVAHPIYLENRNCDQIVIEMSCIVLSCLPTSVLALVLAVFHTYRLFP